MRLERILELELPITARSAERPRFSGRGGGTHNSDAYTAWLDELRWEIRRARPRREPTGDAIRLTIDAGLKDLRVVAWDLGEVATGAPKGDADNIAKAIMDAGTGLLWHDDRQIENLSVRVFRGRRLP